MARADQLKSLIRSHFGDDQERFFTIALQVAAHEAQQGHGALAHEIRAIVDQARQKAGPRILKFPVDMRGLVLSDEPRIARSAMVLTPDLSDRIERIIHEYRQQQKLKSHGLWHRRKILLVGPPGTGKTMTARVLAHELNIPMHTVQVDKVVTKFMGETGAKLRQIFDMMQDHPGVFLFDEFDAIGGERSMDNDVGEMRRVLNAFLQFIEHDTSDCLIIAATNSPKLLDRALFRRFDDLLDYDLPKLGDRRHLIENVLGSFLPGKLPWKEIGSLSDGLSHAEISNACIDAVKFAILEDRKSVDPATLKGTLRERKTMHR